MSVAQRRAGDHSATGPAAASPLRADHFIRAQPPACTTWVLLGLLIAEAVLARLPDLLSAAIGTGTLLIVLAALWATPWASRICVVFGVLLLAPWPLERIAAIASVVDAAVALGASYVLRSLVATVLRAQQSAVETRRDRAEDNRQARAEREDLAGQVAHWASHDRLTEVLNRSALNASLHDAAALRQSTGLLVFSAAAFTDINDGLGSDVGDQLLAAFASRLAGCARDGDLVARLGGDEFAVLLPAVTPEIAPTVAGRLMRVLVDPFTVGTHTVNLHARCGLAVNDGSFAGGPLELLRQACAAARTAPVDAVPVVTCPVPQTEVKEALQLEADLQRALRNDELFMLFQPLVSTATGRIASVEALVRWHHPTRGLVPPSDFVGLAERSGLIVELGNRVLELSLEQLRRWAGTLAADLSVAVNVSARQLLEPGFAGYVQALLHSTGVDPRQLVLELTESLLVEDSNAAIRTLWQLRSLGIRLALDDFGTGYSSLARLGELPLDEMKIDKSFVDRLGVGANDSTVLVTAAIAMGQGLGLTVVAEGVESVAQAEKLRLLGCDLLQGYLLGRPMSADEINAKVSHVLLVPGQAIEAGPVSATRPSFPGLMPDVARRF